MNAGRSPRDEVGQLSLPDPLQALVHLGGVDFALYDVEYGYEAVVVGALPPRVNHHVLRLQQPVQIALKSLMSEQNKFFS